MERRKLAKDDTRLAGEAAVRSHAWKRMDRMTLMGLSLLKLVEVAKLRNPTLSMAGATLQAGSGSLADRTQAAHNLPRDLLINGVSFWSYADKVSVHPRVRMQLFYSSAATMTVWSEANYLDSRWEQNGLPEAWLAYLTGCLRSTNGTGGGTLGMVVDLASRLKADCQGTLAATIALVKQRSYFERHEERMADVVAIYDETVKSYTPRSRVEGMWHIYQRDKYA
jgi:hypothetical protein